MSDFDPRPPRRATPPTGAPTGPLVPSEPTGPGGVPEQPRPSFARDEDTTLAPPMPPPMTGDEAAEEGVDGAGISIDDLFDPEAPEPGVGANSWMSRADARGDDSARAVDVELNADEEYSPESLDTIRLIEQGLSHPQCSEIHANGPDKIFLKFRGSHKRLKVAFSDEGQFNRWVKSWVDAAESVITWDDLKERRHSTLQMADGSSLTVVLPPLVASIHLTVRKHNLATFRAADLVANGTMTRDMMQFLQTCVAARANMLIVGPMGSGKTSALSLLTQGFADSERVAIVEEVPEIWINKPQVAQFTYLPSEEGLGLSDLLETLLYMRIDRVVVGEAHFEITKMLEIMLTGADGSMCTYHARSVAQAVERMKVGLQFEHPNLNDRTAVDMIRSALEVVIVLGIRDGRHRCLEIGEIDWRSSDKANKLGVNLLWEFDTARGEHRVKNRLNTDDRVAEKCRQYNVPINWDAFRSDDMFGR